MFLQWKPWYIQQIRTYTLPRGITPDEVFDELLTFAVPCVRKALPDPEALSAYVVCQGRRYIVRAIQAIQKRTGYKERRESDLRRKDKDPSERGLELFLTDDVTDRSILYGENADILCWVFYRAHPRHKPLIDAYIDCNGNGAEVGRRFHTSREMVRRKLQDFCEDAKALLICRMPPLGFHRNFPRALEFTGGICRHCGKVLEPDQDGYCSQKCQGKGYDSRLMFRRYRPFFDKTPTVERIVRSWSQDPSSVKKTELLLSIFHSDTGGQGAHT